MFLLCLRTCTGLASVSEMECATCRNKVTKKNPGLQCAGDCGSFYHAKCVGLSLEDLRNYKTENIGWRCRSCKVNRSIVIDDDLPPLTPPVRSLSQLPETLSTAGMFVILKEIQEDVKGLSNKYEEVLRAITFYGEKISDFESKINNVDRRLKELDTVKAENVFLKTSLGEVSARLEQLEQYSRRNNLVISGVPESASESLTNVVGLIAEAVGCPVSSNDIDTVHRLPTRDSVDPESGRPNDRKPKSIVVRFLSRMIRDRFLGAAKTRQRVGAEGTEGSRSTRGIMVANLGDGIYVNEHLTVKNAKLLREVKKVAAEKEYKFVWFKGYVVRVRRSKRSRVVFIRSSSDLDKL